MDLQTDSPLQSLLLLPVHLLVWLYSVISFLPWYVLSGAAQRKARVGAAKARSTTGCAQGPYRTVDSFQSLVREDFPGKDTLDKLFDRAVQLFGQADCLGIREVLKHENETQPSGKVFKNVCGEMVSFSRNVFISIFLPFDLICRIVEQSGQKDTTNTNHSAVL